MILEVEVVGRKATLDQEVALEADPVNAPAVAPKTNVLEADQKANHEVAPSLQLRVTQDHHLQEIKRRVYFL